MMLWATSTKTNIMTCQKQLKGMHKGIIFLIFHVYRTIKNFRISHVNVNLEHPC